MGKITKNAKSKLSSVNQAQDSQAKAEQKAISPDLKLSKSSRQTTSKTFRLTQDDVESMKEITNRVNQHSRKNISETKIIQALIQIGVGIDYRRFIRALGEII